MFVLAWIRLVIFYYSSKKYIIFKNIYETYSAKLFMFSRQQRNLKFLLFLLKHSFHYTCIKDNIFRSAYYNYYYEIL